MTQSIIYMTSAVALLSLMDGLAKWLVGHNVAVIQILALRSLIIISLMLLVFFIRGRVQDLKPLNSRRHLYRGLIGFISPLSFFWGLKFIPLTDAVTIFFSSIFTITLLSMVFLREKVGVHRWSCVIVGFVGVLIVATPEGGGQTLGYVLVLLGSITYSVLFVSGRYLSATESVPSLVFSFNTVVGVLSLALLPWFWQSLPLEYIGKICLLALLAASGHYLITLAFSSSEASFIAPFEYTALIWAVSLDWLIWDTTPSTNTAAGAVIIIGSGIYIAYRERRNRDRVNTQVTHK